MKNKKLNQKEEDIVWLENKVKMRKKKQIRKMKLKRRMKNDQSIDLSKNKY
jgi:hypothetical protein